MHYLHVLGRFAILFELALEFGLIISKYGRKDTM
jgi:hypothetical protein